VSGWTCTAPRPGALLYASGPIEIATSAEGVSLAVWGTPKLKGRLRGCLHLRTIEDLSRVEREIVDRMAEPAREGVRVTLHEAFEHYIDEAVGVALLGVDARASLAEVEQWA